MPPLDDTGVTASEIDALAHGLEDAPGYLESITRGLGDARLQRRPSQGSWSANNVLAHLRACADVWGGSIVTMLERDHPTLRYVSPRTWIRKTSYAELPFHPSLQAFTAQRDDLVRTLRSLGIVDWSRGATFTRTTRGREQTVLSYVRRIIEHEWEHRQQIEAILRTS